MKINELSKLSYVNPETIRMYRKLGLLCPAQNPVNKYYDYSMEDLMSLLFIRKLRGSNLSLDAISYTYTHSNLENLLSSYQQELDQIDSEIDRLQKKKFMLQLTIEHLEQYKENVSGISVIEAIDDRIDVYPHLPSDDPAVHTWIQKVQFFTQTLLIRKEYLQRDLPEQVPVSLGLGSYRYILDAEQLPIPEQTIVCPKGTYLTSRVELTNLKYIERRQLQPMLDYIRTNHCTIDSDTTAFLVRIQPAKNGNKYIFRLRVKVKDN